MRTRKIRKHLPTLVKVLNALENVSEVINEQAEKKQAPPKFNFFNEDDFFEEELEKTPVSTEYVLAAFHTPQSNTARTKTTSDDKKVTTSEVKRPCFKAFSTGICDAGQGCPYSHDPKILQKYGEEKFAQLQQSPYFKPNILSRSTFNLMQTKSTEGSSADADY